MFKVTLLSLLHLYVEAVIETLAGTNAQTDGPLCLVLLTSGPLLLPPSFPVRHLP